MSAPNYADSYLAVVDGLIARLQTDVALASVQEIIFGEKESIGRMKFPSIFILPGADNVTTAATNTQQHEYTFEVVVLQKKADMQLGLREAITFAGACYDSLMGERTLNGLVADLKITSVEPDYQRNDTFVLHWTLLRLVLTRLRRG